MIEDYLFAKNIRWVLWGTVGVVGGLLIFHAGVVVGQHHQRGNMVFIKGTPGTPQNGTGGMISGFMPQRGFVENGHGAVGTIATITPPTFYLETRDGFEQKVYAATGTVVTGGKTNDPSALSSGQVVIVIGDPDDTDDTGYLDARIIHILPPEAKPQQ